jgi:hypothetical protein
MEANMEDIKDELIFAVQSEIAELEAQQLVHFKSCSTEYVYARRDGKEYWSVPAEMLDEFKKLMTLIRQFDEQIDSVNLHEATATKFISRYYRMRSDVITRAQCLSVDVSPRYIYSAEEQCSLARVEKARAKVQLLTETPGIADPAK